MICCFCFSVGLAFSTRAGQFNIYLADLHLGIFCPPLLLSIEIFFVFYSYGWDSLKRNIVEMTGVDIYNSTFYVFLSLVLASLMAGSHVVVVTGGAWQAGPVLGLGPGKSVQHPTFPANNLGTHSGPL